jgi:poly(A) polymerase
MIISLPKSITESISGLLMHLDEIAEWRVIGGAVRDILMNKNTDDIDIGIATNPQKVMDSLNAKGFHVIPTGFSHGTVTVIFNRNKIEITSLRKDVSFDGRRANVEFTKDWKEDAQRRDFTINAMSLDNKGNLYDYFNGCKDLMEKRLSFVGDPKRRIEEDHLRVLRYWRFLSNIDLPTIDEDSQKAALECFYMLKKISGERIQSEMLKLLSGEFAVKVINILSRHRLLEKIDMLHTNEVINLTSDPIVNLSMLISQKNNTDTIKNINAIYSRWKLSNAQKKVLTDLCLPKTDVDWSAPLKEHAKYIYKLGFDTYKKLEMIAIAQGVISEKISDKFYEYVRPKMPISGNDVLFLRGRDIKEALKSAEDYWLKKDFLPNKEDLLKHINLKYRTESNFH